MWNQRKKRRPNVAIQTLIGAGTEVHGDLQFVEGCHVDGRIRGDVRAQAGAPAVLSISEKGRVEGAISAPHVVLNGTVHGDVYAHEWLELGASASVTGNVHYRLLEMGAEVNGQLIHVATDQRMLTHDAGDEAQPLQAAEAVAATLHGE